MLDFEFLTANNPGLEKDIIMSVDGDRISGRSETNVSVGNLIASFTSTGHSVFVSEVQNLVGVMVGDVNGSWDAPQNAASVSQSYLASVQQSLSTPISQWAINSFRVNKNNSLIFETRFSKSHT